MNTANDWYEMCVVKHKLEKTIEKIDDMFINLSDGCRYKKMKFSVGICHNDDHINNGSDYSTHCDLETCPIIREGLVELDLAEAKGEIA